MRQANKIAPKSLDFYWFILAGSRNEDINEPLDPCECRRQVSEQMSSSAKIVFARQDLSIPGAPDKPAIGGRPDAIEAHFFDLVDNNEPDVIVLDCVEATSAATDAVMRVRRRTEVPIIVLCRPVPALVAQYLGAGAADCVASLGELAVLNQSIQKIITALRQRTEAAGGSW
jgi:CheY-like chemotaxis protein